jgi:class 3 adenylate cyclase/predicted ATPase
MPQLEAFLSALGLEQHVRTFSDNDIDFDALLELDDAQLKELGLSMGHRVKLLKALAEVKRELSHGEGAAVRSAAAPAHGPPATPPPSRQTEGERRQVTLMFCDLVGSTELSARADPEDFREIMRQYQDACADMIARFDGFLAKFLGDGVLAYFGYPHAHEDAAERAVRAALGIVEAITRLRALGNRPLSVRIGIATGLVVVGALDAAGGASELSAIGETPNVAARLQSFAEPNSIVIADSTHALTRGAFRYTDAGRLSLKGIPEPVQAWRVLGEIATSRFEAAHSARLSSFVGRDQEVGLLYSRWEQAAAGEGQAVLLCGEGGIGKSRIAEQLRHRIAGADHIRVRYQCSPFHVSSALQPAIAQLEYAAQFAVDDDNATRLRKLEALLRPTTFNMAEAVPLLATLLGVTIDDRYAALQLSPDIAKRRTLDALSEQLIGLSKRKPVYLLLEDLHWVDPSTRELIGLSLDRIRNARVLMLLTFRPEFVTSWGHLPHVTTLTLNHLARGQCVDLIGHLCDAKPLPAEVLDQLVAKTDGVPLFIEELTKTVLESGLLAERNGRYELNGPLPPFAIPTTLQDTLMARLERLSPVKRVAQTGAAIGREFSYELLAAVASIGELELNQALATLVDTGLLYIRGQPPEATYVFKHALLQDAAYGSLLRDRRQQLHARIAEVLVEMIPDLETRTPELLAHHYGAAGLDSRAKEYWTLAGRQALARSNHAEAISHIANALTLARKAPPSVERVREESQLILDQAIATIALKGPGSIDTGRVAEEAIEVSRSLGDDLLHFRARWTGWMFNSLSGNLPVASERADGLVAMANRVGATDMKLQAYHARWTTAFLRGQVAVTRDDVEHGLALYDFDQHRGHLALYGAHDPGVCAHGTGACALWQAGFADRAANVSREAIRLGNDLKHPFSQAVAYFYAGFFSLMVGDPEEARARGETLADVAGQASLGLPANLAKIIRGWAMTRLGELGRGAELMETTYRNLVAAKQRAYLTLLGTLVAGAQLEMGRAEEVLNFLDDLQQLSIETHQQMFVSDLHRLRAEALRKLDPAGDRVEEEFQIALQLAHDQGALALELRAATGLAGWLGNTHRQQQGYKLLQPIYDNFTEGLATPDLKAARTLLNALT